MSVRHKAVRALGQLQIATEETVACLIAALRDTRAVVCAAAAETLGSFGPGAKAALPALERVTADVFLTVRFAGQDALQAIRSPARN